MARFKSGESKFVKIMLIFYFVNLLQTLSEKNSHLQLISDSLLVFKTDLEIEKQRVETLMKNKNLMIENMKRKMEKLTIRKENISERKILKAAVNNQQINEPNDGQTNQNTVTRVDFKDDSGRESDGSEQTSDEKDTKKDLIKFNSDADVTDCGENENVHKTVLSYSYWTHYI